MANMHEIDTVLSTAAPGLYAEVDPATKESFGRIVDYYAASGYTTDDVVTLVDEQLGSTELAQADVTEFAAVVDNLCETLPEEQEDSAHETEPGAPAETPSTEDIYAVLGNAAGEDLAEALATAMPEFESALVKAVWQEVRPAILAEIKQAPEAWGDPAVVREAAYYALCDALEGFFEAGDAEGFEFVLTTIN